MPASPWSLARLSRRKLTAARPRLQVLPLECRITPDVTGSVFRDNNFDGRFTPQNDQGFYAGVVVTATNAAGASAAGTTDADGAYTVSTAGLGNGPLRVEVAVPAGFADGPVGSPDPAVPGSRFNGTSVQFTTTGTAVNVDFGLVNPLDPTAAAPELLSPTYNFGPLNGPSAARPGLVSFPYAASGIPGQGAAPTPTALATYQQLGTTYGVAVQPASQSVFVGAYVRRFSAVGPAGAGAVYRVDRANGNALSTLIDLNNPATFAGQVPAGSTPADFFAGADRRGAYTAADWQADAFGLQDVHRIGLGDVDISEDGRTLYAVNLNTRELIEIPVTAGGQLDAARTLRRFALPTAALPDAAAVANPQDVRPFAIAVHDGAVFVGATYTAEAANAAAVALPAGPARTAAVAAARASLRAYVFAFDPGQGAFRGYDSRTNQFAAGQAPVAAADLSYQRLNGTVAGTLVYDTADTNTPPGTADIGGANERGRDDSWLAWDNVVAGQFRRHQPLLTDIEFDRGVMVLGLRDRHGDKVGWYTANPGLADSGAGEGDILRAAPDAATGGFALENNGTSDGVTNSIGGSGTGAAQLLNRGPGGGAFYWSQYLYGTANDPSAGGDRNYNFAHSFLSMGGLFQVPGGTQIATTSMDPVRYSSGGISWLDNLTGARPRGYEVYSGLAGDLGKASGLGDLQGFIGPAPLEIGNRIWRDDNGNGQQDAGEAGVANVLVALTDAAGTTLAVATTAADGSYYFSGFRTAGESTDSRRYGLALNPNTTYRVVVPNAVGANRQPALSGLGLTRFNQGSRTTNSDAQASGTDAVLTAVTGAAGRNDHTIDAGFAPQDIGVEKLTSTPNIVAGELAAFTVRLFNPGVLDVAGITLGDPLPATNGTAWAIDPASANANLFTITTAGGVQTLRLANPLTLPVGQSVQVRLTATAGASANPLTVNLTNTATVTVPGGDSNPNNNTSTAVVTVRSPDVTVVKTPDAGTVDIGDGVGFTVTVRNVGAGRADGVTLSDLLPLVGGAGVWTIAGPANGFVLATLPNGRQELQLAPGTTLTPNQAASVRVVAATTVGTPGSLPNTATVGAGNENPQAPAPNTSTATVTVRPPDVTVVKTAEQAQVSAGDPVAFRVTLSNLGPAVARGVTLSDPLPDLGAGNTYSIDPAFGDAGLFALATDPQTGRQTLVLANPQDLPSGAGLSVRVTGVVSATVASLPNTANVAATNEPPANGGNNTSTVTITVVAPDVTVFKTPLASPVQAGTPAGFELTVRNVGAGVANAVFLSDPLPPTGGGAWAIVAGFGDAGAFQIVSVNGVPTLQLVGSPSLGANGGQLAVRLTAATVPSADPFTLNLDNTATVGAGNEPAGATGNNTATARVTVLSPDVFALKTTDTPSVTAGQGVRFTVTVGNRGQGTAFGVALSDPLPALGGGNAWAIDQTFGDFAQFQIVPVNGVPTLRLVGAPDLAAGAALAVRLVGTSSAAVGTLPNTATVAAGNEAPGPTGNNNTASSTITVGTLSLGDLVWQDTNNNGGRDPNEPGIRDVVAVLLDGSGNPLGRTATTDANGLYRFDNLPLGSYRVRLTPPAGFGSSTGTNGSATGAFEPALARPFDPATNNSDHGTTEVAGTVVSGTVTLTAAGTNPDLGGAGNLNVDFGLFPLLSVGDTVWRDDNNNGRLDAGEAGIGGVAVNLLDAAGATAASTTTNPQGGYLFSFLTPGNYRASLPAGNFAAGGPLAGLLSSTGVNGNRVGPSEPVTGDPADTLDHGTTANGAVVGPLLTLAPGAAPVGESATPGNLPDPALDANSARNQDFGFFRPLAVGNLVWEDTDNSGTRDAAEPGLGGLTVRLLDAAGAVVATTTTNSDGLYRFDTLVAGRYTVQVLTPAGFRSSTGSRYDPANGPFESGLVGNSGTDDADHGRAASGDLLAGFTVNTNPLDLTAAGNPDEAGTANLRQDFGLYRAFSLGNVVWRDSNNNGRRDSGEPGIGGVTVRLLDSAGAAVGTATTDGNGFYRFDNLPAGTYTAAVDRASPALAGLASSTGGVNGSGPFEPAPRPTADSTDAGTTLGGFVRSQPVPLGPGSNAPTGETDLGPGGQGTVDAQADLTVDFGFFQPLSLGNFVWEDANNTGTFDAGERPIPGVTVRLVGATGTTLATATTDANGLYLFTGLGAGTYTVQVDPASPALAGYGSSTGAVPPGNAADNRDNGTLVNGVVTSQPIPLTTADNLTVDFGFFRGLSLGDLVWNDANNNGRRDAGEPGIGGVVVNLVGLDPSNAGTRTATTGADGGYLFTGLAAGRYQVQVVTPAGFRTSTGTIGSPTGPAEPAAAAAGNNQDHGTAAAALALGPVVTLRPGQAPTGENADGPTLTDPASDADSDRTQDFGFFRPLAVGNQVFVDGNNNGVRDPGEPGVGGVRVDLLDAAGAVVASTTTGGDGVYLFDALVPGRYIVRVTPPAGLVSSTGRVGSPTGPVEPAAGNSPANDEDHGTQAGAVITGNPFDLLSANNPDAGGAANLRQDFGLFAPLSLGNLVWEDGNNNGVRDPGEPGLGGVSVTLLDAAGNAVASTATDPQGGYLFTDLVPGAYTVRVTAPAGFVTSSGTNGSASGPFEPGVGGPQNDADHGTATPAGVVSGVTLTPAGTNPDGDSNLRQDFGLYRPLSVGDLVWRDDNNNGRRDPGEPPLPGLTVRLLDAAGAVVGTATTDGDGRYGFTLLAPGTYSVQVTPPAGFLPSTPASPPLNGLDNANVGVAGPNGVIQSPPFALAVGAGPNGGNDFPTVDFGVLGLGSLAGRVYVDTNLNGTFDGGDRPLGGVVITLAGPSGPRTATTDAAGQYRFTGLPPGDYTVAERQPGGILTDWVDTPGSLGGSSPSNDVLRTTVGANQAGTDYNFAEAAPARLFGTVFADLNRSGAFDAADAGIPGVPVTISGTAFFGTPQARPLTAADVPGGLTALTGLGGRYEFPVLPPGQYTVTQGALPAASAAVLSDSRDFSGDPAVAAASVGTNVFTDVSTPAGSARGPLVFAWVPSTGSGAAAGVLDPTKRQFLSSTTGGAAAAVPAPPAPSAGNQTPSFGVTTGDPTRPTYVIAGGGAGGVPLVRVLDYATGVEKFRFLAYEVGYTGGVRTAVGDVTGDGVPDILVATGLGGGPRVRVFDGTDGSVIRDFFAYEDTFTGGLFLAVGDVNGDGRGDIITGTEVGGGPRVQAFDARTGATLLNYFAFDEGQRGGVRIAAGDFNRDGRADVVASTGVGVRTRVRVIDSAGGGALADYAPYEDAYTGGVYVAAGDFDGDGVPDVVVGADSGGGPRVQVFSGLTQTVLAGFFAFDAADRGGARVAARDVTGDGKADLIVATGTLGRSAVRVFRAPDLQQVEAFDFTADDLARGAYVG